MRSLTPENERDRMVGDAFVEGKAFAAIVEGATDVLFWERAFTLALNEKVKVFHYSNYPTLNTTGSGQIKSYYLPLAHKEFRVCLDSEYDIITSSSTSRPRFVYYTYLHSIENFFAAPSQIAAVLEHLRGVRCDISQIELLTNKYSLTCYAPFCKQVVQGRVNMKEQKFLVNFHTLNTNAPFVLPMISKCNVRPDRTIYFLQGHFVFKNWILPLLKFLETPLVAQKMSVMSNVEKNHYAKSIKSKRFTLESIQQLNSYSDLPEYRQILSDISSDV